jgi:protein-tyrosine phosphatase
LKRIAKRVRAANSFFWRTLADLPRLVSKLGMEVWRHGPIVAGHYAVDHVVRISTGAPMLRYSHITPSLFLGGQHAVRGLHQLEQLGVTAVVNLRDEFDDAAAEIAPGRYLHLRVVDDTPPTIDQLCRGVEFIRKELREGGRVYVHCMLGVGRSVTLVAAYLVSEGMTPEHAWSAIRRRRPFIQPTEGQIAQLEAFAKQVVEGEVTFDCAVEAETPVKPASDKRPLQPAESWHSGVG